MTKVDHYERLIIALHPTGRPPQVQMDEVKHWGVKTVSLGLGLFMEFGPSLIGEARHRNLNVMLDIKLHDNPDQVTAACVAALKHQVSMVTVNTGAGLASLKAAVDVANGAVEFGFERPLVIGSTVLTAQDDASLQSRGCGLSAEEQVVQMARLAERAGLDGIECSPQEIGVVRQHLGEALCLIVSGVRLHDSPRHDHLRVGEPNAAVKAGATHLYVGRDIWQYSLPERRVQEYLSQMSAAFQWLGRDEPVRSSA